MKKIRASLLLALLFSISIFSFAQAGGQVRFSNYCFPVQQADRCIGVGEALGNLLDGFAMGVSLGMLKGMTQVAWLLDRGAAFIFSKSVIDNTWILNIRSEMLQQFAAIMPGLLRDIVLGNNGILYMAVALAGVLMTLPMLGAGERLVKIDRVLSWGVILIALFISGTFGYDLIGGIENLRQGIMNRIVSGTHLPTDKLILQPMRAGAGDLGFNDGNLMALPPGFESLYFPESEKMEISIQAIESGVTFGNAWIETEQSRQSRPSKAWQGLFYAGISVMGAYLMFIFSITYILLTFAALVLIVFLFASLPLGFFEFGNIFLMNILERYIQIVVFSFALAIFARWFSSGLGFVMDVNTVENSFLWLVMLIILIVILHVFLNGSIKLLTQSAQTFGSNLGGLFGGPGVGALAKNATRSTIGNLGGVIATGVGLAGLMAARPEAAILAGAARSAFSKTQLSEDGNSTSTNRGDVFQNNGRTSSTQNMVPSAQLAQDKITHPAVQNKTTTPATERIEAEVQLKTLADREGWREGQIQQVRSEAARTKDVDGAVLNLQRVPDFEKANTENLRKAVVAAMARG
jgi:hypothetical protein